MAHPECKPDEVFIGNTQDFENFKALKFGGRIGEQAYDIKGWKLDPARYRPTFIPKSREKEYDDHQMEIIRNGRKK